MAMRSALMGGLKILEKYETTDRHEFIRPGHDQIWVGGDSDAVSDEDRAELKRLGWFTVDGSWSVFV